VRFEKAALDLCARRTATESGDVRKVRRECVRERFRERDRETWERETERVSGFLSLTHTHFLSLSLSLFLSLLLN
jgi:hypothetical protein